MSVGPGENVARNIGRRRTSGDKGVSEWRQRSNDRVNRKSSENDLRRQSSVQVSRPRDQDRDIGSGHHHTQRDTSPRESKSIPSPFQMHRKISQVSVDITPRKSQASEPAIICPSSFSEADIRCAASVNLGQGCAVWCGERDGSLAIRDPESLAICMTLPQEKLLSDYVWSILHDDRFVLVGTSSGRLRVYCASSQELLCERIRHTGGIYALARLGDFVYSASNDFTISEWSRGSWEPTNRILGEHSNQVRCLCTCAGYLASGGDDHVIYVWDLGSTVKTICFHCDDSVLALASVLGVSMSTEENQKVSTEFLWAGDNKGELKLFDLQRNSCIESLQAHAGAISTLLYQDNCVLSSSVDKMVKVWNPLTRCCLQSFQAHGSYVAGVLPVAIVTQVRLWSFGGDKKVRCWHMDRVSPNDDELCRLRCESQHRERRVAQLTSEYASVKASLESKENDVNRLSTAFRAKEAEWSMTQQQQLEEIARLSTTLAAREEAHEKTLRDLDSARTDNQALSKENADLRRSLDAARNECRNELENERRVRQDAASNLAEATWQLHDKIMELQNLSERCRALEHQQSDSAQIIARLQGQLAEALEANNTAEKCIQSFEEQAVLQEALKTSRLGFVTEVWGLHMEISKIKSTIQAVSVAKSSLASNCRCSAELGRGSSPSPEFHDLQESIVDTYSHSKKVIAKYLTDHEKLHLGAPLASYEGGHDSPQPLDWSSISDATSTTRATDCSFTSVDSDRAKAAKQQDLQKGQLVAQVRIEDSVAKRQSRQHAFQPPKRSSQQKAFSFARS